MADGLEKESVCSQVDKLILKVELELSNKTPTINDSAYLPSSKAQIQIPGPKATIDTKYDWYQNMTHAFVTFKTTTKVEAQVNIESHSFEIILNGEQIVKVDLSNEVDVSQSIFSCMSKKIEIKLKKKMDNQNWMTLAKGEKGTLMATAIPSSVGGQPPSYPTSSKKGPKDWSKMDKDIEKELKADKPEGDEALNGLFKEIYSKADPETQKAMIKSYQTSGGTVLSTNWDEVKEKDYEGKDRPSAPDGQEWRKYED